MNFNGNIKLQGGGVIQNARFENLATDPVAPVSGQVWFNTTDVTLKTFDGTDIKPVGGGTDAGTAAGLAATQTGAGLASDGSYTVPTGTNYLNAATSLANADAKLDVAVKVVADAIAAEATARADADSAASTALSTAIAGEVTARDAAILVETNARIAADSAAASAASDLVSTETTARLAGDAALDLRVDGVQSELNATQAASGLNTDGTFTAPASTTFLGTATSLKDLAVKLDAALTSEAADRTAADTGFTTAIAAEVQARTDADAVIQGQIDDLIESLGGEGGVEGDLAAEIANRIAAVAAVQSELDASQAAIGLATDGTFTAITGTNYLNAASTVLGTSLALDAAVKANADAVAAEVTARTTADTNFGTALTTETTNRTTADGALQTELNTVEAGAGLETDGSYAQPTGSNYINSAVSLKDADFKLDAAVKVVADTAATNATAIAAETTARATAISDAITAEVTARDAAIVVAVGAEATARDVAIAAGLATIAGGGYFLYTSSAASTTHVVTHGLGSQYANVTVVDTTDNVIVPQGIQFNSTTSLTVTFNTAIDCKVVISGLKV